MSASRTSVLGSNPALPVWLFPGRVIPVTQRLVCWWLLYQAPGVIGLVLGLVGPVSVCHDWVGWQVWTAAFISVQQHIQVSEQICLR